MNLMEERLAAIGLLLRWEGSVSNARLRELYQLHFTHASRLIAAYRDAFPESVVEDRSRKRFVPRLPQVPAASSETGRLADYVRLLQRTGAAPAGMVLLQADAAEVEPHIFAPVQQAIRFQTGLEVEYRSMRNPEPHSRTVFPHACVQTQGRWHMRAYCAKTASFRDFVLGRVSAVAPTPAPCPVGVESDRAWHTQVELVIEPHRALPKAQMDVVRFERFHKASAMVRTERAALAPYVLHELRVAVDIAHQNPPDYLLMLRNPQRHRSWLLGDVESTQWYAPAFVDG
ncbi:WYL domain-containing protein [Pseudoxanthomonas sp. PXM03]|nr:WYL domain-containing protein [Pseudoxanthomonas sp. PXM03]